MYETSAKIVRKRERIQYYTYSQFFERVDRPGSGFAFPCTMEGTILVSEMTDGGRDTLDKVLAGEIPGLKEPVLQESLHRYTQTAIFQCAVCRSEFLAKLDSTGACECPKCGRLYNGFGQPLTPRSQWEEPLDED